MTDKQSIRQPNELMPMIEDVKNLFASEMLKRHSGELTDSGFLNTALPVLFEILQRYGLSDEEIDRLMAARSTFRTESQFEANDVRIEEIFAELAEQSSKSGSSYRPADELLTELRELQDNQAELIRALHIETQNRPLEQGWQTIRQADDILMSYEDPPATN